LPAASDTAATTADPRGPRGPAEDCWHCSRAACLLGAPLYRHGKTPYTTASYTDGVLEGRVKGEHAVDDDRPVIDIE
jgi:hypothetical protein